MAVTRKAALPRLACGRDAAGVWEHAESGRLDDHEQNCPHCQAVVADAAALRASTAELAAEQIDPPASLVERVMSVIWAELPHDYLPLPARYGPARLERSSAAAVLRHATDQMSGVRARSCQITVPGRDEQTGATEHPDPADAPPGVVVRLSAAMAFGADLPSVAARVQQLVLAAADRLLGLPVDRIDVDVVDVFDPTESGPGGEMSTQ